jgi:hypothetical protein
LFFVQAVALQSGRENQALRTEPFPRWCWPAWGAIYDITITQISQLQMKDRQVSRRSCSVWPILHKRTSGDTYDGYKNQISMPSEMCASFTWWTNVMS